MRPAKTPESNLVYRGPTPDIDDLHCRRVEPGRIHSDWRLSDDELRYLEAGGLVQLEILGEPIPPLSLIVTEPFCRKDGSKMELVLDDDQVWRFACPSCSEYAVDQAPPGWGRRAHVAPATN
jgi:hypothetical protein